MNELNCADFEILLADHIDGVLPASRQGAFARHKDTCAACALLAEDAELAVAFMSRVADVEMPPVLMTKILHATNSGWELSLRGKGLRGWINRTFAPVLQPRFVLGAVFTMISATMLTQCAGVPKKNLAAADMDPVRLVSSLENRTQRIYDRAVKSYQSMKLIYEVKSQISEWSQQQKEDEEAAADTRANGKKLEPAQPDDRGTKK